METTRPDLAELRRLLEAATPGPWGPCPIMAATRRDGTALPCRDQYSLRTMVPVGIDVGGDTLTSIPFDIGGGFTEQDARALCALRNAADWLIRAAEERDALLLAGSDLLAAYDEHGADVMEGEYSWGEEFRSVVYKCKREAPKAGDAGGSAAGE